MTLYMGETNSLLYYFMEKTIDDVTQEELESLYLESDWDVEKIAERMGWNEYKIRCKFASFYNTQEKRQKLVYKFKIINSHVFEKLSRSIYRKAIGELPIINYYQIPLGEIVQSYKINKSFVEIAKKYRTTERIISQLLRLYVKDDVNIAIYIKEELNLTSTTEFRSLNVRVLDGLSKKDRLLLGSNIDWIGYFKDYPNEREGIKDYVVKHNINKVSNLPRVLQKYYEKFSLEDKLYIFPDRHRRFNWIEYFGRFNNVVDGFLALKSQYDYLRTLKDFEKKFKGSLSYYYPLSNEEKELIFPGVTSGSGWETAAVNDIQKEFSDCIIVTQEKFEDCKNINQLPFDIALYSPSRKLIALIEIQGPTHFSEVFKRERNQFEKIRKRDIIKHDYCKTNNIPLFYFTYEPSLIEKYGYPYPIHTVFEELVKAIRELLQKVS